MPRNAPACPALLPLSADQAKSVSTRCGVCRQLLLCWSQNFLQQLGSCNLLFSRVARIPEGSSVMPVISTEERITLGAVLNNGLVIKGQNQISHPSVAGPFQLALHLLTFEMSIYENKPLPDCIVHSNSFNPISFVRLLVLPGSSVSQGLSATITLCRRAQVSTS